jgi:hypothetical protein
MASLYAGLALRRCGVDDVSTLRGRCSTTTIHTVVWGSVKVITSHGKALIPVMTYGAETWTLTVRLVHKFKVAQRAMERAML